VKTIDILFFGDIVGRSGRTGVKWYLSTLTGADKPDVVIANVENASHGFGLTPKNYQELLESGLDIMTGGNHIWDKKELIHMDGADRLLRPANFPENNAGVGAKVFEFDGFKLGVLNLIGQVFMGSYNSPWEKVEYWVPKLLEETPMVFIDCHGEASAEKIALAHYASSFGASAFTGTHTHVQTADERIFNNHTGYLTDTGFNGAYDSIIGMQINLAVEKLRTMYPERNEVADSPLVQINATRFTLNTATGACVKIERINLVQDLEKLTSPIPAVSASANS